MTVVDEAMKLALTAHFGHSNSHDGEPYVLHLNRVWILIRDFGYDDDLQAAAWLHDSVEDTDLTLSEIERHTNSRVARIVDVVTKRKGESNEEYYRRVKRDPDGTILKRADLHENFRRNHMIEDEATRARMGKKYSLGFDILGR